MSTSEPGGSFTPNYTYSGTPIVQSKAAVTPTVSASMIKTMEDLADEEDALAAAQGVAVGEWYVRRDGIVAQRLV